MTKANILRALEPFGDNAEIAVIFVDDQDEVTGDFPIDGFNIRNHKPAFIVDAGATEPTDWRDVFKGAKE